MTRNQLGDTAILVVCIIGFFFAATWGLQQAPREYGLLTVAMAVGALLMARRLFRSAAK